MNILKKIGSWFSSQLPSYEVKGELIITKNEKPSISDADLNVLQLKEEVKEELIVVKEDLDDSLYDFALKMQDLIRKGCITSEEYPSRDIEKMSEDFATISASIEEFGEVGYNLDAKLAARLFLLNNELHG